MYVVALVGRDKYELRHGVVLQVGRKLRIWADMGDTRTGTRAIGVGYIIEVNKGIVFGSILRYGRKRARIPADILLVGLPGNTGIFELGDKMRGCGLVVSLWIAVISDPEVCT